MKTIFAPATPAVKSGVAIIRISGSRAGACLEKLTKKPLPKPRIATLCKLKDPKTDELVDNALVFWFPSPNSFTGEDTAELHIHGSRAVISELISILSQMEDMRLAEPGEFSKRAFLNSKMNLTEAEGLADLIDAETKLQARQALQQQEGNLGRLYEKWRAQIIEILAFLEAFIDFPDEEIPENILENIKINLSNLKISIENHLNNRAGERIRSGLNVIILGAPNTGKSSLINALAKRDIAIVSDIAGTTRDVLETHLDINGYPVTIIDTAGIRENAENIEKIGIEKALEKAKNADLKIIMLDATENLDNETLKLADNNSLIIINKIDRNKNFDYKSITSNYKIIKMSVKDGQGVDELINSIALFCSDNFIASADPLITRERHRQLLMETLENMEKFSFDKDLILATEDLRMAAQSLGKITGKIGVEDLLDKIFSSFCIGK